MEEMKFESDFEENKVSLERFVEDLIQKIDLALHTTETMQ